MKILVDENMPYASTLFGRLGNVQKVPGRTIPLSMLAEADALMVRSITQVNAALLTGTAVRFVGTATAGTDHIDQAWLQQQGIGFAAAPGCNAVSVVEYIFSVLLLLAERESVQLSDKIVGIVGVGHVGGRLQQRLNALGIRTLLCDPPRAEQSEPGLFCSLEKLVAEADILTLHTPLDSDGRYPSHHLVDDALLAALPDHRILINTSRGAVVDNQALLNALNKGKKLTTVLDVWESEPELLLPLLARVDIGTPHIAGYSLEGKVRGTIQVYQALSQRLGQPDPVSLSSLLPPSEFSQIRLCGELDEVLLKRLIHLVYDVRRDDASLRHSAGQAGEFDRLRKHYQERREWSSLQVVCDHPPSERLLRQLGFTTATV